MKPSVDRITPARPNGRDAPRPRHAIPAMALEPATNAVASVAKIFPSVSPKSPFRIAAIATSAANETIVAAPRRKMRRRGMGSSGCGVAFLRGCARVVPDEPFGGLERLVVRHLLRRGLHQVRARAFERAGDAVVQRELGEPDSVNDDAG